MKKSGSKKLRSKPKRPILEALSQDGSIYFELLKQISRGCLIELNKRHSRSEFLANFCPDQILYNKFDSNIKIEFRQQIEQTESENRHSNMMWMAPELFWKNSKPNAGSDVFSLGLLFFFMLTKRGSPLGFSTTFSKGEFYHKVKIDFELLEALTKDTDIILFIDLIKRMIQEVPEQRQTCEDLIEHAALKSDQERLKIVEHLANKCFDGKRCKNEYLVNMMDKKEVHMEGFLEEDSVEWRELLAEVAKLPEHPDFKICSSLLKIFAVESRQGLLQLIIAALPNFFPHLYNFYQEELPKVKDRTFKEIFEHFYDAENLLGTGSYGTIVYRGRFGQREIAIKRVLKMVSKEVGREISIMMKIDRHPHILKYFAKEEDENFIYIGMELCEFNLATFVQDKSQNMRQKMTANLILKQTANGLNHLHQLSIIHRDVKPENILICNDNGTYSVKLADFGISKPMNPFAVISTVNINVPVTIAWIAPKDGEKGNAKSTDVFSLGLVFHFVISDGIIFWQKSGMNYKDLEVKLEEKRQELNDQGKNEQLLQMDLLMRMLKLEPELRPSAKKVLSHPLFWDDKKCLEFILAIRKKFDVLDPKFIRKTKDEHQKILDATPTVLKLKVALDFDKSVVNNDWIVKLDAVLEKEFNRGYDEESVSDLLRAMRNKWMHKEQLKDAVKDLFVDFTEGEYFRYFTSKFPRLLVHCYNAVEKEARDLLAEYFHEDASAQAPRAAIGTRGIKLENSKLTISCRDVITFPGTNIWFDTLKIEDISHLLIEQNKLFTNFLQRNASNVIKLEFYEGSLRFLSMNKILQKLPNLKKIEFYGVEYNASKTNQTIQQTTCQNLVELVIRSLRSSNLLQAFLECKVIEKLTVIDPQVTLEEILQKYASLKELDVQVHDDYSVSDQHKANSKIHQLTVLTIKLCTENGKIHKKLMTLIQKQTNLEQFHFNSYNCSPSQSVCQQLAAHIWQLKHLIVLTIFDEKLLEEVGTFAAQVANTCLEEFGCQLRDFKSLPSSFFEHFTNLRKLDISCEDAEETKVKDLISYMNQSQLTSIWLGNLSSKYFPLFQKLQVNLLQVFVIIINSEPQVPVFDMLQEFLPRHPNITDFEISFNFGYEEPKLQELIPMVLATLTKLKWLVVENCPKITADVIKQIVALKTLKSWKINKHESENFYNTQN